ncbi:hypothetical protein HRR83_007178 [Exophiala dermatitidis]|uniref:Uncharacterized protein n=2 Tax=Exophiala dermatitidis TaxID=5970 RepID=H6C4B6_EXODN|nr:uncharacterized protein HMPREF1120_06462 [Exophiala dermatitidis NIH/UT8656]KAJ4509139.1 hypothetical protein HRR75_006108 [Exophiala dermatitidis]EHY58452.1 hypothetical protein HMPREF1120_06462 [Exophiala dermatitidis NIH/UT8656]KAJ4511137.1 hypothetical protein HRR73_006470 [Exophiala dermatitidis]KAJ4511928.1 hypothetical protein HRR74_006662 [Exophiala dermatitidis]KAJ4534789.1 hypothetical protein HRR76_006698 [Exophiala dermatitidis]
MTVTTTTTINCLRRAGLRCTSTTSSIQGGIRAVSTLSNNPHIYVFKDPSSQSHLLTLLPTVPPTPSLSIGKTTSIPPTPSSFTENPHFLPILHSVIAENAHLDPAIQSQAAVMISSSGTSLFQTARRQRTGSAGASDQGGHGGAGRGGWVHVSDTRHVPDFGRIAEPEDIFGSVEVDGAGKFVDGHGRYQASGTYRIVTRDGILGLTDFMRERVVKRLKGMEEAERNDTKTKK